MIINYWCIWIDQRRH